MPWSVHSVVHALLCIAMFMALELSPCAKRLEAVLLFLGLVVNYNMTLTHLNTVLLYCKSSKQLKAHIQGVLHLSVSV